MRKMQSRKTVDKKNKREEPKDDTKPDEKLKKTIYSESTPRTFIQKSTTADIYAKNAQTKASKKTPATKANASPMKAFLKSSPSSVSNKSFRSKNEGAKTPNSARPVAKEVKSVTKKLPVNVTVTKRKDTESKRIANCNVTKDVELDKKDRNTDKVRIARVPERQRTHTRTLDDEEIKVLTPSVVENNSELLNLSNKLKAQPKAFFIDLDDEVKIRKEKSSDEEVSYEDDFESYESDFDSYHSETKSDATGDDGNDNDEDNEPDATEIQDNDEGNLKEEKMLDSGNFELRDPRSASKSKPMDFITEDSEEGDKAVVDDEGKKASLVDEGFQDMSSAVSSMKTHVDVLERPLFIDFTKSKENRRKKRICERLKQRAKDILSMVTLHEMSYNLFEMAPIPYELYMATYGRFNYKQTAAQTFDDGITEEVQTDVIFFNNKWTQCPVEFSKNIYLNTDNKTKDDEDLEQFNFFSNAITKQSEVSDSYKRDPLRIYLEQKDGAGADAMLPVEEYDLKLKNNKYDVLKLRRFLKKVESRVSNVLSINTGNTDMSNLVRTSKFSFSNGYVSISKKNLEGKNFLKDSKIIGAVFSDTKNNLIITVHDKCESGVASYKCVMCLWDYSMAKREAIKILIATDNVKIGRFRGNTDGYFVGALEDGSIHLWDLSEEATWCNDVAINQKAAKTVDSDSNEDNLTQIERDREWNKNNSAIDDGSLVTCTLQASAYTSSAINVCDDEVVDAVVGLEFLGDHSSANLDNGRKIIRQICSLQRTGIITIWSIIQEKTKSITKDLGKAFWSKMKLDRNQVIDLTQNLDLSINTELIFNLNSAKKRLSNRRQEKNLLKSLSRQNSSKSDIDRPYSAASVRNSLNLWERVECCHLKIINFNNADHYLVAKNSGEVLCCRKVMGNLKIKRISVANLASSITCIGISPNNLPYFLAATDCGTVNLCSLHEFRVLLTLDCRNFPSSVTEKYQSDEKGRFIGTTKIQNINSNMEIMTISSVSHTHPLRILAVYGNTVLTWELAQSDSRVHSAYSADGCVTNGLSMALLTEDEVQIYKMAEEDQLELFNKYVALL